MKSGAESGMSGATLRRACSAMRRGRPAPTKPVRFDVTWKRSATLADGAGRPASVPLPSKRARWTSSRWSSVSERR